MRRRGSRRYADDELLRHRTLRIRKRRGPKIARCCAIWYRIAIGGDGWAASHRVGERPRVRNTGRPWPWDSTTAIGSSPRSRPSSPTTRRPRAKPCWPQDRCRAVVLASGVAADARRPPGVAARPSAAGAFDRLCVSSAAHAGAVPGPVDLRCALRRVRACYSVFRFATRINRNPSAAITPLAARSIHFFARRYMSRGRCPEKHHATTVYQPASIAKTSGGSAT
ncbi:hypothetical protein C7405_12027 [Paraburkholderia caballeronis]|nr:hypothetical protein C7405_12027 [Paraburkholderia caballeronis]